MNIKMTRVFVVLLMGFEILLGLAAGQDQIIAAVTKASETTPVSSTDKTFPERHARYRLQRGYAFDISFELNPEFNQTATVQPDGYITLRGIGDLQVANCTMPELTQELRSAYSAILHEPRITVVLKDFEKAYFIADGQVG